MAACPRWAASYGVMPHVYIVTTGPGSNGTTSAGRCRTAASPTARRSMPVSCTAAAGLVADVQLEQHGGERPRSARRCDSVPASRGRRPGILADELGGRLGGRRVVGADEHVALDRVVEVAQLLGRQVVERGGHEATRDRRPARWRPPSPGAARGAGTRRRPWPGRWPCEITTLPSSWSLDRRGRRRRGVPRRGDDDEVGRRRRRVVAAPRAQASRSGQPCLQLVARSPWPGPPTASR